MFALAASEGLLLLAAAFLALCYLAICGREGTSWIKTLTKTLSVVILAGLAFQLSPFMLLPAALLCCSIGDYCLSREGDESFLTGVGAFAIGHLCYVGLFLLHPRANLARLETGWPLVAALLILGIAMIALLFRKAGALRRAVCLYVPIILAMGLAAITLPMEGALVLVLPAALFFILSDCVLAMETFVLADGDTRRRYTPYVVWFFYWLAQALFLLAFVF